MEHFKQHGEPHLNERPKVKPAEVCIGCIVWLPAKNALNGDIRCTCEGCSVHKELGEGGYNHPMMVIKIQQRKGSATVGDLVCDVVCITTFNDMTLAKYEAQRLRRPHLENSLSIYHPDSDELQDSHLKQLRLENRKLHKQSYVQLKHVYQVDISKLHSYKWRNSPACRFRITELSYEYLVHELGLPKSAYIETDVVVRTSKARLQILARTQAPRAPPPSALSPTIDDRQVFSTSPGGGYSISTPQHHYSRLDTAGISASQGHDRYSIPVVPGSYQQYFDHQENINASSGQTHPQTWNHNDSFSASQPLVWNQGNNNSLEQPQYGSQTNPTVDEEDSTSWLGVSLGVAAALTVAWIWWRR